MFRVTEQAACDGEESPNGLRLSQSLYGAARARQVRAVIAASRRIQIVAVVAALLVHGALAIALMWNKDIRIEGGAGRPEASLGSSFADMATGTLGAEKAVDTAQPVVAQPAIKPLRPQHAESLAPQTTERTPIADSIQSDTPVEANIVAVAPKSSLAPPVERLKLDVPAAEKVAAIADTGIEAVQPKLAQPISPRDVLTPDAEVGPAVGWSLRPKWRSEAFETVNEKLKPAPTPKPKAEPASRGNAKQNAAAGVATGRADPKASASGTAGQKLQASSKAAASNYPGLVMAKISGVARPRAGSRGTVVVGFTVAGGGALGGVRIVSSSGAARLDRAALRIIQSAAPFPAPPPGAQRSFTISIEGR
jgi:protein TonB